MEYPIRAFTEADRPAVEAMGFAIIAWYDRFTKGEP